MGAGAAKRVSAVRWGVAGNIVIAWVLTIPASAIVGGGIYAIVSLFGEDSAVGPDDRGGDRPGAERMGVRTASAARPDPHDG